MKTVHGILNQDGTFRLAEPVEFEGERHVLVPLIETKADKAFIDGSLREYWDRPEEDEAWKDYQDGAK